MASNSNETAVQDKSSSKSEQLSPQKLYSAIASELKNAHDNKTYKYEVPIESDQSGVVQAKGKRKVMLASNNYLGLATHPELFDAHLIVFRDGAQHLRFAAAAGSHFSKVA